MNKRFITFAVAVFLGLASAEDLTPQQQFDAASTALVKEWDKNTLAAVGAASSCNLYDDAAYYNIEELKGPFAISTLINDV